MVQKKEKSSFQTGFPCPGEQPHVPSGFYKYIPKYSPCSIQTTLKMARSNTSSTTSLTLCFAILSFLLLPLPSYSTDPGPLQDFCVADLNSHTYINGYPCKNPSQVTSKDFFKDAFKNIPTEFNKFKGNVTQINVEIFPGLNTQGLSMNQVVLLPGGTNPPHVHPRASELSVVVAGKLFVGWVSTRNKFYWKVLSAGELFVIPPGLVHFQLNVGEERGQFYAAFNSQNPGVQFMPTALFNSTPSIPDQVLTEAFQVDESIIERIKSGLSALSALRASY